MKLRRGIGLAVLGAGVAAASRAFAGRGGDLEAPLDGDHRTFRWRGIDVAYTEAGDPDAPTVVLLHGINAAASSGEYREVFDDLAAEYHVVAPDLPGFGCSDRPPIHYSADFYEAFVAAFLDEFAGADVVASGLTAAYVAAATTEVDVGTLVLICPTAVAGPDRVTWLRELFRAPVVGRILFDLLTSKPSIRYFNADHGYYDPDTISEEWVDYEWRTTHRPDARFAPASFVSGFLNSDVDLGATLAAFDGRVTLVWGREAGVTPLADGRELAEAADARLVVFDDAKLLPHVEHSGAFLDHLRDELDRKRPVAP